MIWLFTVTIRQSAVVHLGGASGHIFAFLETEAFIFSTHVPCGVSSVIHPAAWKGMLYLDSNMCLPSFLAGTELLVSKTLEAFTHHKL